MFCVALFFFFKQKTAYEMRIRDWSSDVCSSDLELTMSQDDTPDLATPQAGKVAPEAVVLRAQPRPVTRLNRRTLAILVGSLSVAVLGATIWMHGPFAMKTRLEIGRAHV